MSFQSFVENLSVGLCFVCSNHGMKVSRGGFECWPSPYFQQFRVQVMSGGFECWQTDKAAPDYRSRS